MPHWMSTTAMYLATIVPLVVSSSFNMDLPLYLYQSQLNNDFALLPTAPSNPTITNLFSYVLFDNQPVGYASKVPFHTDNITASTPLFAYFSTTRKDVQTTHLSNATALNKHGGDYVALGSGAPIAHIASITTMHYQVGVPLAPLWLVYSDARTDVATSPFNPADLNAIVLSAPSLPFRQTGAVLGYLKQGTCELCQTSLSETFPSLGGPDCMNACGPNESFLGGAFYFGQSNDMKSTPGSRAMQASMLAAGNVLRVYNSSIKTESGTGLHVSFLYNCCYNDTAKGLISKVLSETDWVPQNVTFDRAVWRIDNGGAPAPTHYSIIVLLDEESNGRMEQWVAKVEAAIAAVGVSIHIARSAQEPFHTTLGVVDGTLFPVETALERVNQVVSPGTWTGTDPLVLTKPSW